MYSLKIPGLYHYFKFNYIVKTQNQTKHTETDALKIFLFLRRFFSIINRATMNIKKWPSQLSK